MLYKSKTSHENIPRMDELRSEFEKLYEEYEIDIVGAWAEESNPSVTYYISKYLDEDDYNKKVERLRNDVRYSQLTNQLKEIRIESTTTRLIPK